MHSVVSYLPPSVSVLTTVPLLCSALALSTVPSVERRFAGKLVDGTSKSSINCTSIFLHDINNCQEILILGNISQASFEFEFEFDTIDIARDASARIYFHVKMRVCNSKFRYISFPQTCQQQSLQMTGVRADQV